MLISKDYSCLQASHQTEPCFDAIMLLKALMTRAGNDR